MKLLLGVLVTALSAATCHGAAEAVKYIVDGTNGDDSNNGENVDSAFKTIARCAQSLTNPGDECQIRAGHYHEVVTITGLEGTADAPIKIVGYEEERPVWDGTVTIQPSEWNFDSDTGICSAQIDQDIFALLYKNDMLTPARWPNSKWSDKSIFDNQYWRPCRDSERGTIVDDALAESNLNFTGSMAILNVGSWNTWVREVLFHEPTNNNFTYNDDFGNIKFKHQQYYLEASLELLDAPEEWFYDMGTKMLHLIMPDSTEEIEQCPDTNASVDILRGRTLDNVLEIIDSTDVVVANITFHASNIIATKKVDRITFDSLIFNFPSSSHRMLKSDAYPKATSLGGDDNAVINCTFYGAEGPPLQYSGGNMLVHNSEFLYSDWAGQGNLATVKDNSKGSPGEFSQNSMYYNGVAHGFRAYGIYSNITLNHIIGQCWGKIQSDGASIHMQIKSQTDSLITNNWIHDSPKKGIRFDTPSDADRQGNNGNIGFNVVWNLDDKEIYPKGNNHTVYNNVGWDDSSDKCTICVPSQAFGFPMNSHSIVVNNGASKLDNGGGVIENNYESQDVKDQMVDTDNYDFRPVAGGGFIPCPNKKSEDWCNSRCFTENRCTRRNNCKKNCKLTCGLCEGIGAYSVDAPTYWIPGRKLYKTSFPIPQDGGTVSKERGDVICQTGYQAERHDFYFGESFEEVDSAGREDDAFQMTLYGDENIFALPLLNPGEVNYYWRVDAIRGDYVYKGDVWNFKVV